MIAVNENSSLGKSPSLHSCVTSKGVRLHAEKWNMTLNGCTACMCVNGTAECKEPICSPIPSNCRRAYQRPGECCRVCVRVGNGTAPITEPPATSSSSNVAIIIGVVLAIIFIGLALALGWYFIKRNPKWLKRVRIFTIFQIIVVVLKQIPGYPCTSMVKIFLKLGQDRNVERFLIWLVILCLNLHCNGHSLLFNFYLHRMGRTRMRDVITWSDRSRETLYLIFPGLFSSLCT